MGIPELQSSETTMDKCMNWNHDQYPSKRRGSKHNINRHEYLCNTLYYAKRGNDLPQAKVNKEIVRKIRIQAEQGITAKYQASEYGVHIRTIEAIRSYKTWANV